MTALHFEYMTEKDVETYLKKKYLYPQNAHLIIEDIHRIKESVEGFVNLIYRISDKDGNAMVLKQIVNFPRSRAVAEENGTAKNLSDWTLDTTRLRTEAAVLIFWNQIKAKICPEIYLFDEENNIIVMEDLSHLNLLRFELCKGHLLPNVAPTIGEFFAKNLFFSSDLMLTTHKKKLLQNFFDSPEYDALYQFVFVTSVVTSMEREMPVQAQVLRKRLIENPALQVEIKRLGDKFITHRECLIHTDLHSSNLMVSKDDLRIIDTEFAGFGPIAQDIGRLMGSYLLNFCSWYGDTQTEKSVIEKMQAHVTEAINNIYNYFANCFENLVNEYKGENYTLRNLDIENYLYIHFQDIISYAGINAISRISNQGLCYDLQRLEESERIYPILLVMTLGEELMLNRGKYQKIEEVTTFINNLARNHPKEGFNK